MTTRRVISALAAVIVILSANYAGAQNPAAATPAAKTSAAVPVQVQIVISRFQGEKKVSSLPYTLSVTADGQERAQLRMGADVPVPSTTFQPVRPPTTDKPAAPEKPAASDRPAPSPLTSFSYRPVGTEIDCTANAVDDGRFRLTIAISDSTVYPDAQDADPKVGGLPVFRSFRSTNMVVLRDGQSRQFTAATDRISGEVVRAEVTLTILK